MELPQSMQDALSLAGESVHIPDAQFPSFVEVAFRGVINSNERNAIEKNNDGPDRDNSNINITWTPRISTHRAQPTKLFGLKEFTSKDSAAVKEAYAGLVAMVIEAAKQDTDIESLSSLLEDCKFPPERIKEVSETYQKNKPALQILLGSIGRTPAHIVDVDWRLDYYVKNNHMEKVNEAVYLITLKTELPSQKDLQEVQFSCSQEQLQDLVGKLKDACKCLERISQGY